jgi:hypothetical protein
VIILDTNVLSELMRPQPSAQVSSWIADQTQSNLYLSTVTEAEVLYGIELLPRGARREGIRAAAETMFEHDFANRILPFDRPAAQWFGKIASHRRAVGRPIGHSDGQIASIARSRGAQLATRNIADFAECGLELINPWNG